jgi:hypothetical protein
LNVFLCQTAYVCIGKTSKTAKQKHVPRLFEFRFLKLQTGKRINLLLRNPNHIWKEISNEEILRSSKMYLHDEKTGEKGLPRLYSVKKKPFTLSALIIR